MKFRIVCLVIGMLLFSACTPVKEAESEVVSPISTDMQTEFTAWLQKELFLYFGRMGEEDPMYARQYEARAYEKM